MQTLITCCLCLIILLLLSEKFEIWRKTSKNNTPAKNRNPLPEIIGRPKDNFITQAEHSVKNLQPLPTYKVEDLDIEPDENEATSFRTVESEVNQKDKVMDLEDEEEELAIYAAADEAGFARGVTFDELSEVATLVQSDNLSAEDKQTIVHVIAKVKDTELFTLLEQSISAYSQDIADYLNDQTKDEQSTDTGNERTSPFDIDSFL
ncbi:hypothetical protein [Sphingobacterium bambusae]|uniref:Conjugal transfer protein TraD n=1 Tax=Sphingobacterium bambusae TaxID=662858 RepID=A0ABW6BD83_9SPHI|nr:hypothetical protein [Sphingobacterium bambusae]WPL49169.1 hypothetical protein SCB77_01650 [Sphingobacterium bambusae]